MSIRSMLVIGFSVVLAIFCYSKFVEVESSKVSSEETCEDPEIKGNQTTYNGELIYHVPGGRYYDVTDAEEWFCTEEEAEEAGYRASEY
ncbi:hypothetical protein ABE65_010465 [Fictibacillus phosphorivorans]|uniref:Uncharacterized protein n=1 Tax=Fictibacillus phosphorivorans TaxID=1221500 RepID=A0A160ILU7_9BACL|nr:hypothetical protein [Fictibacillus phosphorivorans]ANC77203.1 hypothetical protein ABE65_010465 [Fictibacillus phosphorivorans]